MFLYFCICGAEIRIDASVEGVADRTAADAGWIVDREERIIACSADCYYRGLAYWIVTQARRYQSWLRMQGVNSKGGQA